MQLTNQLLGMYWAYLAVYWPHVNTVTTMLQNRKCFNIMHSMHRSEPKRQSFFFTHHVASVNDPTEIIRDRESIFYTHRSRKQTKKHDCHSLLAVTSLALQLFCEVTMSFAHSNWEHKHSCIHRVGIEYVNIRNR